MKNQVTINKIIKPFNKKIEVASDKSLSIRCVMLSSIAIGRSRIFNLLDSEDVTNAIQSMRKLGVKIIKRKQSLDVYGVGINGFKIKKNIVINAGNSGTLARCILGLCSRVEEKLKLIGDKSLSKRDFSRVIEPLKLFGVNIESKKGKLPVTLSGTYITRPIDYLEDKGSAQVKTCVMLSAINTHGITKIKAKKSRNHTELLLKYLKYPIKIKHLKSYDLITLHGVKQFNSFNYKVPGDISSASFFIVLTLLARNSSLVIKNVNINSSRAGILKILSKMRAKIKIINQKNYRGEKIGDIKVKSTNNFKAIKCPKSLNSKSIDEFMLIFLVAAKAQGISKFENLDELNKKESPRLDIAINFLKKLGIKVVRKKNDIKIFGNPNLKLEKNYHVKNFLKDHRVFMMTTVAALTIGGNWKINDKDSIKTSFPNFLTITKKLGAIIN